MSSRALALVVVIMCGASAAVLGVTSCSAFGAATAEQSPDGAIGKGEPLDGGGDDGSSTADAGEVGEAGSGCFAVTAGEFTATSGNGGIAAPGSENLVATYPGSSGGASVARWRREVPVPAGMNAATLTVDAVVQLPVVSLPVGSWYAGFASIVNGPDAVSDSASSVHAVLSQNIATTASIDLDLFPTGGGKAPAKAQRFGVVTAAGQPITVVLDVVWSTGSEQNARANLGGGIGTIISAPTLSGAIGSTWTIGLGGAAEDNPPITITYTRVCFATRQEGR